MLGCDILIPFKSVQSGKSRLAGVLDDSRRQELCVAMLVNTLDLAMELVVPGRVWLVSADPQAKGIAATRAIACLGHRKHDLNSALDELRDAVCRERNDSMGLLVLPTDLCFATSAAIRDVLVSNADVIIVGDTARLGTNLLYLQGRAARNFRFAYGPDSFRRHCEFASDNGLSLAKMDDPRLAFDLDTPTDYQRWREIQRAPISAVG